MSPELIALVAGMLFGAALVWIGRLVSIVLRVHETDLDRLRAQWRRR